MAEQLVSMGAAVVNAPLQDGRRPLELVRKHQEGLRETLMMTGAEAL